MLTLKSMFLNLKESWAICLFLPKNQKKKALSLVEDPFLLGHLETNHNINFVYSFEIITQNGSDSEMANRICVSCPLWVGCKHKIRMRCSIINLNVNLKNTKHKNNIQIFAQINVYKFTYVSCLSGIEWYKNIL